MEAGTKKRIDYLKNFGFADEVTVVGPSINAKVDEMRAAYDGLLNFRQVDTAIEACRKVADKYRETLRETGGIAFFEDISNHEKRLYLIARKNRYCYNYSTKWN